MSRLLLACAVIAIWAGPASAQYFGQNKVSYETFDFQVLRTANFDVYHYPAEAEAVALAARLAEQWRIRLADVLGFDDGVLRGVLDALVVRQRRDAELELGVLDDVGAGRDLSLFRRALRRHPSLDCGAGGTG